MTAVVPVTKNTNVNVQRNPMNHVKLLVCDEAQNKLIQKNEDRSMSLSLPTNQNLHCMIVTCTSYLLIKLNGTYSSFFIVFEKVKCLGKQLEIRIDLQD